MTYNNAPIQEAVFDVRVKRVENISIEYYESLKETALLEYPNTKKKLEVSGKFKFEKNEFITQQGAPIEIGVIFTNGNGNRKIQFRKDGYTFNQLRPYSNWEDFSEEAFKYWNIYKEEIKPSSIKRIASRFINKIDLPLKDNLNLEKYFKNIPKQPSVFKQGFDSLFLRMQGPCNTDGFTASINCNFNKPENDKLPFILDIDVFGLRDYPIDQKLKTEFLTIRNIKNNIFESFITDKTRNLFK